MVWFRMPWGACAGLQERGYVVLLWISVHKNNNLNMSIKETPCEEMFGSVFEWKSTAACVH